MKFTHSDYNTDVCKSGFRDFYDTTSLNDVSSTTFFLQEPLQIGFVDTSLKDEFLKKPVKLVVLVVKYSQLFLNNVAVIEKKY